MGPAQMVRRNEPADSGGTPAVDWYKRATWQRACLFWGHPITGYVSLYPAARFCGPERTKNTLEWCIITSDYSCTPLVVAGLGLTSTAMHRPRFCLPTVRTLAFATLLAGTAALSPTLLPSCGAQDLVVDTSNNNSPDNVTAGSFTYADGYIGQRGWRQKTEKIVR